MDEMISRAAVIDVINESNSPIAEYLIGEIMALPSAQEKRTDKRTEMHACDLISRAEAIDAVYAEMPGLTFDGVLKILHTLPPAQPERKRGKWIAVTEDGDVYKRICSCCGREAFFQNDDPDELYDGGRYELSDFCPHCGADMREVDDE